MADYLDRTRYRRAKNNPNKQKTCTHSYLDLNYKKHTLTEILQYSCTAVNLFVVLHLADHGGFGPHSCSLYALVGSFPSKTDEEFVTMDGFPSFG